MPMLEERTRVDVRGIPAETGYQQKQRRQMYLALGLLLTALIVVVVKDRQFWLGSSPSAPDATDETTSSQSQTGSSESATPSSAPASHSTKTKSRVESHPSHGAAEAPPTPVTSLPSITTSNRAALPPLEIEVVAGDQHRMVQPANPSLKVDLQTGSAPLSAQAPTAVSQANSTESANGATNAGERVRLSADTAQMVERPVEPNYPMLAKQMKVQGSVVLQALIGREGAIQDLRVLSGPAILSTAAMDAVKQWRFRPYYQSGEPIETEARITVNFTISTY
jgi:TonB family protein